MLDIPIKNEHKWEFEEQLPKELIRSLDHVSEITIANRHRLIEHFKAVNRTNYSDHYAYIAQSCRHLSQNGFFFEDKHLLVCIGFHREKNCFVLVNPVSKTNSYHKSMIKLCKDIYKKSLQPIYIKHVSRTMHDSLLTKPDFHEISRFPWHDKYYKDDNTYPEVVIDLTRTIADDQGWIPIKKIRLRVNRFNNSSIEPPILTPYHLDDETELSMAVEDFVRRWSDDNQDVIDSYEHMIHHMTPESFCYVAKIGDDVVGFFVFGLIGEETVGAYANICDAKKYPGIAEVLFLEAGNRLYHEHQIRYVNLGGSEEKALYRFKIKFCEPDILTKHIQYIVYSED